MTIERDDELAELIENIDVSGPRDGFFDELETTLVEVGAPIVPLNSHRRRRWLAAGSGAVAAVAVAIVLIANVSSPEPPSTSGLKPLLAAQVVQLADEALGATDNIQARVDYSLAPRSPRDSSTAQALTYNAVIGGDGSFSLTQDNGALVVYSAETGVLLDCAAGTGVTCDRDEGLTASDPRARVADRLGLSRLQALLVGADVQKLPPLQSTSFEGRSVWKLELSYSDNPIVNPIYAVKDVHTTVLVDQQTHYPVQAITSVDGHAYESVTLHGLMVNQSLKPTSFSTEPPTGASARTYPGGFERAPLGALGDSVRGLAKAATVPAGFELAETSIDRPHGTDVVTFRKGLEQFTVTARPSVEDPTFAGLFVAAPGEAVLNESRFRLAQGRLAGTEVQFQLSTADTRAFLSSGDQLFTIEGSLNKAQVTDVFQGF